MPNSNKIVSLSGSPIYRHDKPNPPKKPQGTSSLEQITAHIEHHLGLVENTFHEIVSDTVHIDVLFVHPTQDFPFVRMITSGMSDLPMPVPPGDSSPRYAELMLTLPGYWDLSQDGFKDETWYWPVRLLKFLARLPHKYSTWLAHGHTIPNGDPTTPYAATTALCGALLSNPVTTPEQFCTLKIDDQKEIAFYAVLPLYSEEMNLKLRLGTDELLYRMDEHNLTDIVDPLRVNVAQRNNSAEDDEIPG